MDTYADDLAALVEALDLRDAIHVGHSTGGGEVARYIGRHGTSRVAKAVLIGAMPPLMLKTDANPVGTPMEAFDEMRAGVSTDRSQFWSGTLGSILWHNRPRRKISEGVRDFFWLQGMRSGFPAAYDCIKAFSETDLTEDLKRFDVPTLDPAWRRRSDRADRRIGDVIVETHRRSDIEGLSRRATRHDCNSER